VREDILLGVGIIVLLGLLCLYACPSFEQAPVQEGAGILTCFYGDRPFPICTGKIKIYDLSCAVGDINDPTDIGGNYTFWHEGGQVKCQATLTATTAR